MRISKLFLAAPAALVFAVAALPVEDGPFRDLPFDQAVQKAQTEGKLFLVDFMATWCGPCKKMDRTTWTDSDVLSFMKDNVIAVQIDIDQDRTRATEHRVEAIPLMVVYKDGKEFDRSLGYKSPKQVLDWLREIQAGKRAVDALAAASGTTDVGARHDLAKELASSGDYDAALKEYLWLWQESLRYQPSFVGVRGSFLLNEIARLTVNHPPAREAFEEILDGLETAVRTESASPSEWGDFSSLGRALGRPRLLVALFDEWKAEDGTAPRIHPAVRNELFEQLLEDGRYVDGARMYGDVVPAAQSIVGVYRASLAGMRQANPDMLEQIRPMFERRIRVQLSRLHAAALSVDHAGQASTVADALLELLDDADSRMALVEEALAVQRAGDGHARWLDEAAADGTDVSGLRSRLQPAGSR